MTTLAASKTRKRAKSRSAAQLRILFDNTNEHGICMLDAEGRIVSWNMSAERLIGYTSDEVVGKNYALFFSPGAIDRAESRKVLAVVVKKGSLMTEGVRVRKDGTSFWARSSLTLVKGTKKGSAFFVLITHDISKGRAIEQKREEYISIASHELKNPITTLSLYSELLAKRLLLDPDKKNLLMMRDIQGQAARLVTLVDDLLVVSKIEGKTLNLNKEKFDIGILVEKIVRDFKQSAPAHTVSIRCSVRRRVFADKARIAQVLINILSNATKYSPEAKPILVRVKTADGKCVVSVCDGGAGIAPSVRRQIFTRFFRTADVEAGTIAGTGLGLYISKEILKRHRERLWVVSVVGKGSTFSFTLPLV